MPSKEMTHHSRRILMLSLVHCVLAFRPEDVLFARRARTLLYASLLRLTRTLPESIACWVSFVALDITSA